jgi:hypothetical protein
LKTNVKGFFCFKNKNLFFAKQTGIKEVVSVEINLLNV